MKRWVKWVAFAVGLGLYLVLSVKGVALGDRAIVVGMAVDKPDGNLTVTAQVLVPVSGGEQASGASGGYVVTSVEAESLSSAFNKLAEVSGKAVALSHCNLFILGNGITADSAYRVLDYVVRNAYLSENAFILAAESGKDILNSNVAYGEMTSLYLQEILNDRGVYSDIARRTVKEYVRSYYSHERGNWLPYIEKTVAQSPNITGEDESNASYIFTMNTTAVINGNEYIGRLSESATEGLVYLTSKVEHGTISFASDEGRISVYILGSSSTVKYNYENMNIDIDIKLTALIKEIESNGEGNSGMLKKELSGAEHESLKSSVADKVSSLLEASRNFDVDIINIYEGFYRDGRAAWTASASADDFLQKMSYQIDVEVVYE